LEEVHYETTIPTVQDRFIQQLLLQVLTPIFDPQFSEHSYGFRPGRSAQDAVRAAQQYDDGKVVKKGRRKAVPPLWGCTCRTSKRPMTQASAGRSG
jgi:hypothetical protein